MIYPENPAPTHLANVPAVGAPHVPACACQHPAPQYVPAQVVAAPVAPRRSLQVSPGGAGVVIGGVLVVGTVLVSMLLALAVTATSVAVCAVVLRSLLNNQHKR